MHRTQTRLRIGFGLVAMVAVLAMVAFMTMVSSNGTTSASTGPTPTPDGFSYKVLAKVTDDTAAPALVIAKESGQIIVVGDVVLWNGQRWDVTARPDETHVTLDKNPCASQSGANYPADTKWIYLPKPCDDGNLSGIYDYEVTTPNGKNTLYHCIIRVDHDSKTDAIKTNAQCYSDQEIGDPSSVLSGVNAFPNEGPNYPDQGPPPPPPYTNLEPFKGLGEYFPTGANADCASFSFSPCAVFEACIERTGAGSLGPNLGIRVVIDTPKDDVALGKAELFPGFSLADCAVLNVPPAGDESQLPNLGLRVTKATAATPVAWRTSATDYDGDGCTDAQELAKPPSIPKTCGDDPWNPTDSNVTDHSGAYGINVEVKQADTTAPGTYFSCLANIVQNGNGKSTDSDPLTAGLVARAFCYQDSSSAVNKLGYAPPFYPYVVTGDGYPGGGPGWGAIPIDNTPACTGAQITAGDCTADGAETDCSRYGINSDLDEDQDGTVNDGCPGEGFGDTEPKQVELVGFIDNADNKIKIRGCFPDTDASSTLKYVYIELEAGRYTGVGTVNIWPLRDPLDCQPVAGYLPHGQYLADNGQPGPVLFRDAPVTLVRQPGGDTRDTDQDGCPDAKELGDDSNLGGLRDPYNPYDWYDTNKDGSIDLFIDILGVIGHYSLDGSPPYDINWDRGGPINGGEGSWSRKAPDGAIDLFFDILGVISQYSLTGCT